MPLRRLVAGRGGGRARRSLAGLCGLVLWLTVQPFDLGSAAGQPDLPGYATVETAVRARPCGEANSGAAQPGYLGVELQQDAKGQLTVRQVASPSPALAVGVCPGDVILTLNGKVPGSVGEARDWIQAAGASAPLSLSLKRAGRRLELKTVLDSPSRPLRLAEKRGLLGVQVTSLDDGEGLRVTSLTKDMPAARAGLKVGDILLQADGVPLLANSSLTDTLAAHEAGDRLTLTYRRGDAEKEFTAELAASPASETEVPFTPRRVWRQPRFRLAVIGVEFADTAHNRVIGAADWERFFFSTNACADRTNATGQRTYGSVNDYYREISCDRFHFEGRVFDWVRLSRNRADYAQGTANRRTRKEFFNEVLAKLIEREGSDTLAGFDGLTIIYAGERFATANRGTLFWPHRSATTYHGKSWPYVICPEGGRRMANISVFCHEFGHVLGLPDLYARPENPGSEGIGPWCAMSNQSGNGRPQHFSAWCKAQFGWLEPTVIDPVVKQKLVLSPVEGATNQCFKVLVRPDGAEYFLLENRQLRGFDQSLASHGLLIWRVVGNRLMLEESHGVEGPAGPRVFLTSVAYPSRANTAFTPVTTPSSRPQLAGGKAVWITQIQQLADGRIVFEIGADYD